MTKDKTDFGYFDSVTARYGLLEGVQVVPKGRDKTIIVILSDAWIREIVPYGRRSRTTGESSPADILDSM